jgi:transcriptional regulator with XRE-family HTH domain
MDTLGSKLKNLREENGFTLEYVANKLKTTKTSIGRYEKNDREPKSEMITSLADFYNVSTDYLLGRTDKRNFNIEEKPKLDEGIKTIAAHRINPHEDLPEDAIEKINDFIRMVELDYKNKK